MKTQFLSAVRGLSLLLAVWMNVLPGLHAQVPGEAAYYYLGDYPGKTTPGWNVEAQGLAHDQENWYITQDLKIWKIPVWHDLNSNAEGAAGVITRSLCDVAPLCEGGYNHFGDPECYETNGQTFLLVPIQGGPPGIALFKADSLTYVNYAKLDQQHSGQGAWCAVDRSGSVYTSVWQDAGDPTPLQILQYKVEWEKVSNPGEFSLTLTNQIVLREEDGTPMSLPRVQGGVITPSGTLLYLLAGYVKVLGGPQPPLVDTDGIHVFDLTSGRRVKRSERESGIFRFYWNPDFPISQEEPEGLTFWDLDDGRAPNISGQLHVLLLDNDGPDDDDILVKHYTSTLYVDRSYNGDEKGSLRQPFNTVNEANNLINAANWNGAQITIKSGSYPEALTFSKHIAVVANGGPVTIGQ